MRLGRRSQAAEHTAAPGPGQHPSPQRAVQPTVRIPTTHRRHAAAVGLVLLLWSFCVHLPKADQIPQYHSTAILYLVKVGCGRVGRYHAGHHPTPGGTPCEHPTAPKTTTDHYHQHVRQAWDNYQKAEQTRTESLRSGHRRPGRRPRRRGSPCTAWPDGSASGNERCTSPLRKIRPNRHRNPTPACRLTPKRHSYQQTAAASLLDSPRLRPTIPNGCRTWRIEPPTSGLKTGGYRPKRTAPDRTGSGPAAVRKIPKRDRYRRLC